MGVLAFDTSTEFLSVCYHDSTGVTLRTLTGPLRHGATLAPLIQEVLDEAGLSGISEVDLVACSEGPGSFTGLRIGYATAKGLVAAQGGRMPMVAVPTLEIHGWRRRHFAEKVMPLLDARKGRFYTAVFQGGKRLTEDQDASTEELVSRWGEAPVVLTGFHAGLLVERLGDSLPDGWSVDPDGDAPTAIDLAQLVIELQTNGSGLPEGAGPRYVRRSDAELAKKRL